MVSPDVRGQFIITIANIGRKPITLQPRQILGHLTTHGTVIAKIESACDPVYPSDSTTDLPEPACGDNLTLPQKNELMNLLSNYHYVFAVDPKKPSRTTLLHHEIVTPNVKPVYTKPLCIPFAW